MPAIDLTEDQAREIIQRERVVRVSFYDGTSSYLIPLGYVSLGPLLYGVTEKGRKTQIAEANPQVAFQIDTSASTGIWEWSSVSGEGEFTLVSDPQERQHAFAALQTVIAEAPVWWQREQGARMASGELHVWKITPTGIGGRQYVPEG